MNIESLARAIYLSQELLSALPPGEHQRRLEEDIEIAAGWETLSLTGLENAYHDARDVALTMNHREYGMMVQGIVTTIHAALFAAVFLRSYDQADFAEALWLAKDAHQWTAEALASYLARTYTAA